MNTKIFILYTGGTIGMALKDRRDATSGLVPQNWDNLQSYIPAIQADGIFQQEYGIQIDYQSLDPIQDSSQLGVEDWQQMGDVIFKNYENYDGFIIIHGTDTMAYTASALSFVFQNLAKPVVLTGSQLPISHSRTDAIMNLSNAIHIAGYKAFNLPCIPEVSICFYDRLLRGNRASKISTRDFEGFESPNYPHLAELYESVSVKTKQIRKINNEAFGLSADMNNNVLDLSVFPGLRSEQLRKLVLDESIDGLILNTYGSGNVPTDESFMNVLTEAANRGTLIMFISQCYHGGVQLEKYGPGRECAELGVLSGYDMTKEAALTKMMWVLANVPEENRRAMLQKNLAGEID
jgi:L-asparaginase